MVNLNDSKVNSFNREDLEKIWEYVKTHYSKDKYSLKTIEENWINPKRPNPNFTGIVAEKVFFEDIGVDEFLINRPMESDIGDGIAYPNFANEIVFDIKGAFWDNTYPFNFFRSNFNAMVMLADIYDAREKGIDAFVFGIINSEEMKCYYTGWIDRESLVRNGEERNIGDFYSYVIKHSLLEPLASLCSNGYEPITKELLDKRKKAS